MRPGQGVSLADLGERVGRGRLTMGVGRRGFDQVARFGSHVDGVVVGSALVEALERGDDVKAFLGSLR